MIGRRDGGSRLAAVVIGLVFLQFGLRPWLGDSRVAPDFLLVALILYTIQSRPGEGAVAGFLVGLLADAMSPAAFGAGALAHTVVGYFSAWGKAVFFAENLAVNAGFLFAGTWLRNLVVLLAAGSGLAGSGLWQMLIWSPLMGLTTALTGLTVILLFRQWLSIRVVEL